MAALPMAPISAEEWDSLVPDLFGDDGWTPLSTGATDSLSQRECPWGGRLFRITMSGIRVEHLPEDLSFIMARPEVRAKILQEHPDSNISLQVEEVVAPGEIIAKRYSGFPFLKMLHLLFGSLSDGISAFYHPTKATILRQKLRRNFPSAGDSMWVFSPVEDDEAQKGVRGLFLCRKGDGDNNVDVTAAFSAPDHKIPGWAQLHLWLLVRMTRNFTQKQLNMPFLPAMRALDQRYYVVLQVQSCKRGPPLLPAGGQSTQENAVSIEAGRKGEGSSWVRYDHAALGRFRLSQYLSLFLGKLFGTSERQVYDSMDGRQLVPYQCVMRREDWEAVRETFMQAFLVQKTAYRRANGGSTAPSFQEVAEPRFLPSTGLDVSQEKLVQADDGLKVFVRNTFLDVDDLDEEQQEISKRKSRKNKTACLVPIPGSDSDSESEGRQRITSTSSNSTCSSVGEWEGFCSSA